MTKYEQFIRESNKAELVSFLTRYEREMKKSGTFVTPSEFLEGKKPAKKTTKKESNTNDDSLKEVKTK